MQRAAALNREYGITSTPTLVVAGRYATRPGLADPETPIEDVWRRMLAVVDQLVAESRACRDGGGTITQQVPRTFDGLERARCDVAARVR